MASFTFPQLSSGALVQYPIRKGISIRTVQNICADGSILVAADPGAGRMLWTLSYVNLVASDVSMLQTHFESCSGPLHAFTFLDPTDNLLVYSADLTAVSWNLPPTVTLESGLPDPAGGNRAFKMTNAGAAAQQIMQTVSAAPANYQYCFSIYASSASAGVCSLIRSSSNDQQSGVYQVGGAWSRIVSSGHLNDISNGLSVAISLDAGQSVLLFGPQLEPQLAPSRFRPTYSQAGIYPNAHWAVQELVVTAQAPNLFSTSFSIDSIIPD
jgi:hypothetical protein